MKKVLFTNWNLIRIARFALGLFVIQQGYETDQPIMLGLGILLAILPLLNLGCNGNTCAVPQKRSLFQRNK